MKKSKKTRKKSSTRKLTKPQSTVDVAFNEYRNSILGDRDKSIFYAGWAACLKSKQSSVPPKAIKQIAVGRNGTILTSPDGINWASRISGTTEPLFGITYAKSQFVAVGDNGIILTSPDSINWVDCGNTGIPTLRDIIYVGSPNMVIEDNGISWNFTTLSSVPWCQAVETNFK